MEIHEFQIYGGFCTVTDFEDGLWLISFHKDGEVTARSVEGESAIEALANLFAEEAVRAMLAA